MRHTKTSFKLKFVSKPGSIRFGRTNLKSTSLPPALLSRDGFGSVQMFIDCFEIEAMISRVWFLAKNCFCNHLEDRTTIAWWHGPLRRWPPCVILALGLQVRVRQSPTTLAATAPSPVPKNADAANLQNLVCPDFTATGSYPPIQLDVRISARSQNRYPVSFCYGPLPLGNSQTQAVRSSLTKKCIKS